MAYSPATIGAAELAHFDADKPAILAANALRDGVPSIAKWTRTGDLADADETEDFARVARAYDGYAHPGAHTYPEANRTTWYLGFQLSVPQVIDSLVLCGSNLSAAATISVQVADSADFLTNPNTIAVLTPPSPEGRVVSMSFRCGGPWDQRISDVKFIRLVVTHATGYAPRIRELWIGQRVQLESRPHTPVDDRHYAAVVTQADSKSGVITQARHERGGARREAAFAFEDSAAAAVVEGFWDDCREGAAPFWWVETPSSDPQAYLMKHDGLPEFSPTNIGNNVREWRLPMREQNPLLALEG